MTTRPQQLSCHIFQLKIQLHVILQQMPCSAWANQQHPLHAFWLTWQRSWMIVFNTRPGQPAGISLRERLQNPTSTQLPLICSPNLGFLSRDLGPTVRDSVFVTGHFWMRMIFSEIVWGWVKRSYEGGFSVARTGEGGSTPWICAPKCSLRDT